MIISEVVQLFNAKRSAKGKWVAKCPCHDDRSKNTLSIKEGNRGILLHCWAGCAKQDVLAAVGLRMRDMFYTSRDVDSAKLRSIRKQQYIDRLYVREVRMQDLKLWLKSLECRLKPVRTKDSFARDIEAAYRAY